MQQIIYGTTTEIEYDGIVFHMHQPDYDIIHTHNCYEFTMVIEGSYLNVINGRSELLNKGSAILLGLKDAHKIKLNDSQSMHLNILIQKEKFEKICNSISSTLLEEFFNLFPMKIELSSDTIFKILSYIDLIKICSDSLKSITASLIVTKIIEEFTYYNVLKNASPYPQNFKIILDECNSIKNLNWKSTDVAAFAHYSQTHLNRLFKKYLNLSVVEYLTKIKMNASINMLTTTNYSVSEISKLLGYSSISYFNKIFFKNFNLTPYKYKMNHFRKKDI